MFDLNSMMGKMQEIQAKVKEAQENLVNIKAEGEAGAGLVKATVNGKRQVISIEIDNDIVKPEDKEMLEDLTIAAINKALESIEGKIKEEMQKTTAGTIPNIPGFDLNNMF